MRHAKAGDGDVDVRMGPRGLGGCGGRLAQRWMDVVAWVQNSDKYIGFGVKAWFEFWCVWVWFCVFPQYLACPLTMLSTERTAAWLGMGLSAVCLLVPPDVGEGASPLPPRDAGWPCMIGARILAGWRPSWDRLLPQPGSHFT